MDSIRCFNDNGWDLQWESYPQTKQADNCWRYNKIPTIKWKQAWIQLLFDSALGEAIEVWFVVGIEAIEFNALFRSNRHSLLTS